ncbi:MAG: peptidoglycan-binding protein [Candidatus Obscuribacterales bacterium]|nr:peptidoglycan-binding protein [Steroidobacteraceae bacterium]
MQIILIGQPELREVLDRTEHRQLAQRITGRFHLAPLSRAGTSAYIKHRLKVAGATTIEGEIFTRAALAEVHRISKGIPRVINVVCDRALLGAYTENRHRVDAALIRRAAGEVYGRSYWPQWFTWAGGATAAVAIGILSFSVWQLLHREPIAATPIATSAQPAAPTAIAPAAASLSPTDIQTLLTKASSDNSAAFAKLLKLWGAKFSADGGRPCDQALAQGLECVYQKGSWGQLRQLNRPAILSLSGANGQSHHVVITALDDDHAQVTAGENSGTVSLASLSRDWLGEYLILWRPQTATQRSLSIGMRGDEVRSLRQRLNSLVGSASDADAAQADADLYDATLAKRIEQFQREHRLSVDGIAGLQTQIVLDSLLNPTGAPRLLPAAPSPSEKNGEQTS